MTISSFSPVPRRSALPLAFSLVEVTLALGIMAFGLMATFGLLSFGLKNFRTAIDTSLSTQIAQRVIGEAAQTDFDQLVTSTATASVAIRQPVRYFDDQGNEVTTAAGALYHVNTRVIPGSALPGGSATGRLNLALVTVQVTNNPANQNLPLCPGAASDPGSPRRDLWQTGPMPMSVFSVLVARNE